MGSNPTGRWRKDSHRLGCRLILPSLSNMKIRYATLSKQGKRRNNEDYLMVVSHPEANSWMGIICDGMGGHAHGEVASKTVAESISRYWGKHLSYKDDKIKASKACQNAFRTFNQKSRHVEMGTTIWSWEASKTSSSPLPIWEIQGAISFEKKKDASSKL